MSREGFEFDGGGDQAARVSSSSREGFEARSPGLSPAAGSLAADAGQGAASLRQDTRPVPGRLVLQDEGGAAVTLDLYATGRRHRLARISVRRDVLTLYALDLLRAAVRAPR